MKTERLFFIVIALFFLTACQGRMQGATPEIQVPLEAGTPLAVVTSVPADVGTPLIDLQEATPTPPLVPSADLVINAAQGSVDMRVGQSVFIVAPGSSPGWDVTYDKVFLDALLPLNPGLLGDEKGWLFRAVAAGETTISFVSQLPACEPGHPCMSMPTYEFSVVFKILP
jgi:hypothetical protein